MSTRTLHRGPEPWFPHEASKWFGAEILALLVSLRGFILEAVTAGCFLVMWPKCQEDKVTIRLDRDFPHPFTGSSSPRGLKIRMWFPPDMASSGLDTPSPRPSFLFVSVLTPST